MKNIKKWLIASIILVGFILSNTLVNADPTVDNIETAPESPELLSTFKVIATITGENILSVNISVLECSDEPAQCYISHLNIPATLNDNGKYELEITLEDEEDRTDHVQYIFTIVDEGVEYQLAENDWKTYLDLSTDDNGGDGDGEDNGTPGFELVFVLLAVIVGVILYRKKR